MWPKKEKLMEIKISRESVMAAIDNFRSDDLVKDKCRVSLKMPQDTVIIDNIQGLPFGAIRFVPSLSQIFVELNNGQEVILRVAYTDTKTTEVKTTVGNSKNVAVLCKNSFQLDNQPEFA